MADKAQSETYAGRVVDEYGKEVAGAMVYALQLSQADDQYRISYGRNAKTMVTDAEGRFVFSKAAVVSLFDCDRCRPFESEGAVCVVLADTGDRSGLGTITLDVDGVLVLQPPVSLSLRVVDLGGAPVTGVRARIEELMAANCDCRIYGGGPERWEAVSNTDGYVEWEGLPNSCTVEVSVTDENWAPAQAVGYTSHREAKILPEIRLQKGASVSGRVLLPDGSPAANFVVGFHSRDYGNRSFNATTDAQGRYHVRHLVPGECYLSFVRSSNQKQQCASDRQITFTARDAEEIVLDDIRLIGPTMIRGTVVEEGSGAGVAGVDVALFSMRDSYNGDSLAKGVTDAAGRFQLEALIRDPLVRRLVLRATRGTLEGYQTPVPPFEDSTEIVLRPLDTGSVFGTVLSRAGAPIAGARVELHEWGRLGGDPIVAVTTTDENGDYGFDNVPSALYAVTASAAGFATGRSPEHRVLMPDKPQRKDVRLKPLDRPVSVLVLDRDSNPVPRAMVYVEGILARLNAEGRFQVTAGKGRLNVIVHGPAQTFASAELPAGRKSITVILEQRQNR